MSYPNSDILVNANWLLDHKDDPNLVIVDCPWEENSYRRAHIPGAVCRPGHAHMKFTDSNGKLTPHLPNPEDFAKIANKLGIGPDTTVILYDDWGSIFATRLWWVLRYFGHTNAKVLNGGWQGWISSGLPISIKPPEKTVHSEMFTPKPQTQLLVTLEDVINNYDNPDWTILDVRSEAEYNGEVNHGNKRVGHIPGATHLEWKILLENSKDPDAVPIFRPAEEIQSILDEADIKKDNTNVTHCQAAVRATFVAFAFELLGYPEPKVYDGSMSEWANLDSTPLEL